MADSAPIRVERGPHSVAYMCASGKISIRAKRKYGLIFGGQTQIRQQGRIGCRYGKRGKGKNLGGGEKSGHPEGWPKQP